MLLRLKIVTVHPVALLGHDHGACAGAAAPRLLAGASARTTTRRRPRSVTVTMALKEEPESNRSGFAGGGPSWDPGLEIQVPFEQRPVWFRETQFCSQLDTWTVSACLGGPFSTGIYVGSHTPTPICLAMELMMDFAG